MAERNRRSRERAGGRTLRRFAAAALIFLIPPGLGADSLNLTTWYPAPYGVYSQLRSTGNSYFAYQGGNVGIGTTAPQAKLMVAGGQTYLSSPAMTNMNFDPPNLFIYATPTSGNAGMCLRMDGTGMGPQGQAWQIESQASGYFGIRNATAAGSTAMLIDAAGHVGIGRTPGRLAWYGGVHALDVKQSGVHDIARFMSDISGYGNGGGLIIYGNQLNAIDLSDNPIPMYLNHNGATVYIGGSLQVNGAKNFRINHPSKPGYKLIHSSLEGPEIAVFYRGKARLVRGEATIRLPDYFEALTRTEGRTVQLTPIGGYSPLFVSTDVVDGCFTVKTASNGDGAQAFFWEVKAIRKDLPPLEVEEKELPNEEAPPQGKKQRSE